EGNLQRRVQASAGRFGGAHIGAYRDVHAHVSGRGREDGAYDVQGRGRPVDGQPDDHRDDHADDRDDRVLAVQVGGSTLLDGGGDLPHAVIAGGQAEHEEDQDDRENNGGQAAGHPEQN